MRSLQPASAAFGILGLLACAAAGADPAPFDLAGPTIEVQVSRGTVTLPISGVPNLAPGDHLRLKAALSGDESAHYLLVVAFLRGSTDPPPREWFFRCDTWSGSCAKDGMTLTVPDAARQVLVFLAPRTGGDFKTLVNAVRGRPGVFVRTSQELNQAALEHLRLEAYLTSITRLGETDPARLKEAAPLLSRSLAIKVDEKCLDRMPALQAACLMQGRESLIMADGHSVSVTQELTSGAASDLAMQAINTPQLKSGYYGPFIGSLLDIARLFDSFHTAQYQYIPALASARGRELRLTLNAPPSFHNPKSVLVATLPAIGPVAFPALRSVDPKETFCARKNPLILPVEGAPPVFAGAYARGLKLRVPGTDGTSVELPANLDPLRGGFAIDTSGLRALTLTGSVRASLEGEWGFDKYAGPSFQLTDARSQPWNLADGDAAALVVGREDAIHLRGGDAGCVESVALRDPAGQELKVEWKGVKADELDLRLSLEEASPGDATLLIRQYGAAEPQRLALRAYAEAAHLESFALHAGDRQGTLRGKRLDEVDHLVIKGVEFVPGAFASNDGRDELTMIPLKADETLEGTPGETAPARVTLKDARTLDVKSSFEPPRPSATLIGKSAQPGLSSPDVHIRLGSPDELPEDATLTFALRAGFPSVFARSEKIEVATLDDASSTVLDFQDGALTLENSRVAVATLSPVKALGTSAFGPLRFRRVVNGVAGDWRPLVTLVRLPALRELRCASSSEDSCTLLGTDLFLLDSVSGDVQFGQPTQVPDGFTGAELPVPRPTERHLYVKLRDDPTVISETLLEVPAVATVAEAAPAKPASDARASTPVPLASDSGAKPTATPASVPANPAPDTADGALANSPRAATGAEPSRQPAASAAVSPPPPLPAPENAGGGHL
jgi:hypothetical protein